MNKKSVLSSSLLLSIYLIIPLLLVLVVIDLFVLGGQLKQILPDRPEEWAWWLLVFNTPHIISSFITTANQSDWVQYKLRYIKAILVLVVITLLINGLFPALISLEYQFEYGVIVFAIYGFFTLYHVFSQQYGISLILGKAAPSQSMKLFKMSVILLSLVLFIHLGLLQILYKYNTEVLIIELILALFVVILSVNFFRLSKTNKGKIYHLGNVCLVLSVLIFVNTGYGIFALIVPRFIHDITAFLIYSNHDENRFRHSKESHFIYDKVKKLKFSPLYLSISLGVVIAFLINQIPPIYFIYIILVIDFFHYYIERFLWKSGASHRQYLNIV